MAWTNEDVARQFAEIATLLKLSGADHFLHKPFEIEELIDRMCALLEIESMDTTSA